MAELKALLEAVQQNNESMEAIEEDLGNLRVEISQLPDKYIPRVEADEKADKIRKGLVLVLTIITLIASTLGAVIYLNHGVTCGVRGILVSAQTASARNPLPTTLTDTQRAEALAQRERARVFYKDALERLDIIWPCDGEKAP